MRICRKKSISVAIIVADRAKALQSVEFCHYDGFCTRLVSFSATISWRWDKVLLSLTCHWKKLSINLKAFKL